MDNNKKEEIIKDFDKWYESKKIIENSIDMIDDKMIENAIAEKKDIYTKNLIFKYNEEYKWYEVEKEVEGKKILIHSYGLSDLKNVLKLASRYYNELDILSLKECIVNEYYENDKDTELNGITKENFINNLDLLSIQVDSKYVEYWFDDNDMYGGHSIVISKKHDDDKIQINLEG